MINSLVPGDDRADNGRLFRTRRQMPFLVAKIRTNALVRALCSNGAWAAQEVLAQHGLLPLVIGADIGSVEDIWLRSHPLERKLADGLAVLDHERDVPCANLERGAAATGFAGT